MIIKTPCRVAARGHADEMMIVRAVMVRICHFFQKSGKERLGKVGRLLIVSSNAGDMDGDNIEIYRVGSSASTLTHRARVCQEGYCSHPHPPSITCGGADPQINLF